MNEVYKYRLRLTELDMEWDEYLLGVQTHRVNGPASLWENGDWSWWLYGSRHRYYGQHDNVGVWYIHGREVK